MLQLEPFTEDQGRPAVRPVRASRSSASLRIPGFRTRRLARMSDSLVRVQDGSHQSTIRSEGVFTLMLDDRISMISPNTWCRSPITDHDNQYRGHAETKPRTNRAFQPVDRSTLKERVTNGYRTIAEQTNEGPTAEQSPRDEMRPDRQTSRPVS